MHGNLTRTCSVCGQQITWMKYTWQRPDGYTDWDLDVRCGCGAIQDETIRKAAFADFHVRLRADVRAMQNAMIDRIMGPGANDALEALCREHGRM